MLKLVVPNWLFWLIGYPLFLAGRLREAHFNAKCDVKDALGDSEGYGGI